jgi:hypothetical protein
MQWAIAKTLFAIRYAEVHLSSSHAWVLDKHFEGDCIIFISIGSLVSVPIDERVIIVVIYM